MRARTTRARLRECAEDIDEAAEKRNLLAKRNSLLVVMIQKMFRHGASRLF